MKSVIKIYCFIIICFLVGYNLNGQNKENSKKFIDSNKSYFSISTNYNNDAVFMGRKDSVAAPYLFTTLSYQNKNGIYASGSFSYLTKSDSDKIDLYLLSAGYNFYNNNWFGDISVSSYFFSDNSYNVASQINADLTALLQYEFKFIHLGLNTVIYFSDNNSDFFLSPQLSYDFISKNRKFQFSPVFSMDFGSQNFYQEYYTYSYIRKNKGSGSGSGNDGSGTGFGSGSGGSSGTTEEVVTNVVLTESEKFNLMNYEISLPIWYSENSFTISFIPTFSFPQNGATIVIDESIDKEELDNTFYWLIGFKYKFKI